VPLTVISKGKTNACEDARCAPLRAAFGAPFTFFGGSIEPEAGEPRLTLWTPPIASLCGQVFSYPPTPRERPGRLSECGSPVTCANNRTEPCEFAAPCQTRHVFQKGHSTACGGGLDGTGKGYEVLCAEQSIRRVRQTFLPSLQRNDDDFSPNASGQSAELRIADLFLPCMRERVE
jgi:hypothetical protein